jgi:hypothetical protein
VGVCSLPVQHRAYRDGRQCRRSSEEISSQCETDGRSQHLVAGCRDRQFRGRAGRGGKRGLRFALSVVLDFVAAA